MKIIEAIRDLSPVLIALLWPSAILIIVFRFRKEIAALLTNLRKAQLSSNMFMEFGEFKLDARGPDTRSTDAIQQAPKQFNAPASGAKWGNVANIFWLGSDLHWTAQTVLRVAPQERIVHGLRQSYHHISELGLGDSIPGKEIARLKEQVKATPEVLLDRQWRSDFAEKIYAVVRMINDLLIAQQPGFRPSPLLKDFGEV